MKYSKLAFTHSLHVGSLLVLLSACASNNEQKIEPETQASTVPNSILKGVVVERRKQDQRVLQDVNESKEMHAVHKVGIESDSLQEKSVLSHHRASKLSSKAAAKPKAKKHLNYFSWATAQLASSVVMPQVKHERVMGFYPDMDRENYAQFVQNPVKLSQSEPVSTFSIDVDTGSYSNVRRMITQGDLPPEQAVRIEEMINYFNYQYEAPKTTNQPFNIHTELAKSPWSGQHALLKIGLKGFLPVEAQRPAANLVFLLDVSGSMNAPDKLPLLKKSLLMLSRQLTAEDKVSIVVYAGASGVVLEPIAGNQTFEIEQALEKLSAGGSTNGQAGIHLAYQLAKQAHIPEGINRVILATDGDFNVGTRDVNALKKMIEEKRKSGTSLTTLGFGTGNYNDQLMEQLADVGNGQYAYIDTLKEARKVLVQELSATLMIIAKDVKIQVEFNPAHVSEYRLVGYENRALSREDFNNDKVDAGEIGAGHSVTAIYELALTGHGGASVDALRYQLETTPTKKANTDLAGEMAFIKFRYKAPNQQTSQLIKRAIVRPEKLSDFESASTDFRFAASVAHFGQVLKQSKYIDVDDYQVIIRHAAAAKGKDELGYRSEFIQLVRLASNLANHSG